VKEFSGLNFSELLEEHDDRVGDECDFVGRDTKTRRELVRRYELAQRARARLIRNVCLGWSLVDDTRRVRASHHEDREKQAFYGTRAGHRLERADRIAAKYLGEKL
jgi:hypothetical protein